MRRVVWSAAARDDVVGIRTWITRHSPQAAARIAQRIRARVAELREHPELGRAGRIAGTRELVITDTDFIVIYVVERDAVVLLTVVSGRQDR